MIRLFRHFLRRGAATVTSRAMSPQAIKYRMGDLYATSVKGPKEYGAPAFRLVPFWSSAVVCWRIVVGPHMPPLERAARKLCEIVGHDPDEICIGEGKAAGQTWLGWEAHVSGARAVIAAIREPDEIQSRAAASEQVVAWGNYREFWRAMIDELANER